MQRTTCRRLYEQLQVPTSVNKTNRWIRWNAFNDTMYKNEFTGDVRNHETIYSMYNGRGGGGGG